MNTRNPFTPSRLAGLALLALAASVGGLGCTGTFLLEPFEEPDEDSDEIPLKPVGFVELDRYMGRWYMIANIPYFAERGNLAPYVEYRRRSDVLIEDVLVAQDSFDQPPVRKVGEIEITAPMTNAEGRITFLKPIWQDFAIVYLDDDYKYSVIAHPTRNYCWLFAREPYVSDKIYQEMIEALRDNGYDVSRILKFPHKPEEIGLPGYQ